MRILATLALALALAGCGETETERAAALDWRGDRDGVAEVQDLGAGDVIAEDHPRWDCHTMGNFGC